MELLDEITSYVDNEITDNNIKLRLTKLIADDCDLNKEYIIQKTIKNLLMNRLSYISSKKYSCDKLRNRILNEINNSITNKKAE